MGAGRKVHNWQGRRGGRGAGHVRTSDVVCVRCAAGTHEGEGDFAISKVTEADLG